MCHNSCLEFGKLNLKVEDVNGQSVLEVGSQDINGSLRPFIEAMNPSSYIGVDIQAGPGVDEICESDALIERFGPDKFDLLICTEALEHIKNWKETISNFKNVLKPDGILLITTRSIGFAYHSAPFDFWRYQVSDMQVIFSDFIIEVLEKDTEHSGVFLKARKPKLFEEQSLEGYQLYSILKRKRISQITEADIKKIDLYYNQLEVKTRQLLSRMLSPSIKQFIKQKIWGII